MHETDGPDPAPRGSEGSARLLMLVGRSAPPHRLADELLRRWHAASGSPLPFAEWADPSTDALAGAFNAATDPDEVERAVVAFARARAGADHDIESVAADLVALVRLAWPSGHDVWHGAIDPVGLVARGLSAWATVHATAARSAGCIDPTTGLATADYLRERIRELHGQCDALAISPAATFAALVVQLDTARLAPPDRVGARVAVARRLSARFRAGETLAAPRPDRMVVVMPGYGLHRAVREVRDDLAGVGELDRVEVTVSRLPFEADPDATFRSLAGTGEVS
mgnify:FL=1|jgi:GGDEF domain-containing protein